MAGLALGDIHLRFAWQAWYLWDWAGSGDALGPAAPPRYFAWQAWHLVISTFVLRGKHGTCGTGLALVTRWSRCAAAALCVAGMALGDICRRFTWQAWYLWDWAGSGDALGPAMAPRYFAWQRDTWRHLPSFHGFTWHAWYLATSTVVLRGRHGTFGTGLALVTRLVPLSRCATLSGSGTW